jgi:hypothetical protein
MMAARASNLVKKVRDRLSGLVTKKVTIPMKPGSFQEFFDPLEEFEEKYNELVIAIGSFCSGAPLPASNSLIRQISIHRVD